MLIRHQQLGKEGLEAGLGGRTSLSGGGGADDSSQGTPSPTQCLFPPTEELWAETQGSVQGSTCEDPTVANLPAGLMEEQCHLRGSAMACSTGGLVSRRSSS